jgi:hypothetical protein
MNAATSGGVKKAPRAILRAAVSDVGVTYPDSASLLWEDDDA